MKKIALQAEVIRGVNNVLDSQEGDHSHSPTVLTTGQGTASDVRQPLSEQPQNIASICCEQPPQALVKSLPSPLAALFHDPNFASPPNLAQWGQGSEEVRRASLETFICQSIQDQNFFKLCKNLDGTWQKVLLGKTL